ncbi:MAG TPA: SRPBCC family protein [Chthoniobacterales bacterium]|jgi:ligand-binding SRPBCC domain-containing protein|nr:SRPBCC family protein [Chthoniobacterales bacterium]
MPVIDITTRIHAPIQRVFDLSRSVELHAASTAQTGERAIAGVTNGLMGLGEEVTWRARHFGIWQNLTSRITAFERPIHFRDSLVRGAFRRFDHDHFFSQEGDTTVMRDVFDYESPLGFLGRVADRLFLKRYMERLLVRRNAVIKAAAETDEWRRYIPNE